MTYDPVKIARCEHSDMDDKSGHGDSECKLCGLYHTDVESVNILRQLAITSSIKEKDIQENLIDYGNEGLTREVVKQIQEDEN